MTTLQERTYIRRSTLMRHLGNLVLELEAFLLELFEDFVGGRLVALLDAKDPTIGCVVTARQTPEQIIGFCEPRDEHGFLGKFVL